MDLLQNVNGGTVALLAVGLCVLCLVLPILLSGLHVIGAVLGTLADVLGAVFGILSGGPAQWCGCLVAIGGCGFLVLLIALIAGGLSNCASYPTNLCALFGR